MQIAITGIGIVSALGLGKEENRRHLLDGQSALRSPEILPTSHHEWPIGEVRATNDSLNTTNMPLTRNILLGAKALEEAVIDCGREVRNKPFVNGTTVGGMDITEEHYAQWLEGSKETLPLIRQHEADFTTTMLATQFGLGTTTTLSTACSSALNAIIHGAGLIRTGVTDCVVAGGTEAMTRFHLNGFASLGILSEKICRPFMDDRDGINLGEGAAYLVLEDASVARERGAHIYGYLAGYANFCDAYHQTASSPDGEGAFHAMTEAIQMAGIKPQQIDYINAHGTATPNNDASEMCAIGRLFGNRLPVIESTKPLTGHTTSASGSIEAIFTLWRMQAKDYSWAVSNAFGFGGNDSSIVLSKHPVDLTSVSPTVKWHSTRVHTGEGIDCKTIIPAMQARRMTPMMRQLIVAAKEALEECQMDCPDGIVAGTRWGGMIPTLQLLNQLAENGEHDFSPAQFMNSTHNFAAGTLARFFECKGYNTTVVSASLPFDEAEKDARLVCLAHPRKRILVCSIDEVDTTWNQLTNETGIHTTNEVKAQVIWAD